MYPLEAMPGRPRQDNAQPASQGPPTRWDTSPRRKAQVPLASNPRHTSAITRNPERFTPKPLSNSQFRGFVLTIHGRRAVAQLL